MGEGDTYSGGRLLKGPRIKICPRDHLSPLCMCLGREARGHLGPGNEGHLVCRWLYLALLPTAVFNSPSLPVKACLPLISIFWRKWRHGDG